MSEFRDVRRSFREGRSETDALRGIITYAQEAQRRPDQTAQALRSIIRIANDLIRQIEGGVHINPPLVVFGNPPLGVGRRFGPQQEGRFRFFGQMSRNVHEVRYTHAADGKDYKHVFESGSAEMFAVLRAGKHDVLLTGGDGQPLWEDFK